MKKKEKQYGFWELVGEVVKDVWWPSDSSARIKGFKEFNEVWCPHWSQIKEDARAVAALGAAESMELRASTFKTRQIPDTKSLCVDKFGATLVAFMLLMSVNVILGTDFLAIIPAEQRPGFLAGDKVGVGLAVAMCLAVVMAVVTCFGTYCLVSKAMTKDSARYASAYAAKKDYPRKRKLYLGGVAVWVLGIQFVVEIWRAQAIAAVSAAAASEPGSVNFMVQKLLGVQSVFFWPLCVLGGLCALIAGYGAFILAEQQLIKRLTTK